jgi:hypothetical protein
MGRVIRDSAIFALLLFATTALAQTAPDVEVFGGYQYFHANSGVSFSGFDNFSLNGWEGSVSGYFNHHVGITADFSGVYGTPSINVPQVGAIGIHTHLYTFMFGPTVRAANKSPLQPFAHALFGGAHLTGAVNIPVIGSSVSDSDTGFAWAAGGGLDYKALPFLAIRVAQFDFVQTHIGGDNQNHFRYSGGVVLRF